MRNPRETTAELIEEQPEMERFLEHLLTVDAEHDNWTFEDIDLDSGTFGELVDTPLVESTTGGYVLTDRDAIRAALDHEDNDAEQTTDSGDSLKIAVVRSVRGINRRHLIALMSALAFVFAVRVGFMWSSTFRGENIVLAANDPYFYQYWGRELISGPSSALSISGIQQTSLPGNIAVHDVLMIVFVWWTAALLGGSEAAVSTVLAWYPPVFGVLTAALVYSVSRRMTGDWRVGLAAVILIAVTPAHAFRTALGFGDHHAMDILFIALTAWGLIIAVDTSPRNPRDYTATISSIAAIAVGVTGSVLTWRGGPIYLFAVAGCVFLGSISAIRSNKSPVRSHTTTIIGLFCAAVLTLIFHWGIGWTEPFRGLAPVLLLVGTIVVLVIAEITNQTSVSPWVAVGIDLVAVSVGSSFVWRFVPDVSRAGEQFIIYMNQTGQSQIAETISLFGGVAKFLSLLGLLLFIAFPYAVWASLRAWRQHRPTELIAVTYFSYLFVLTTVQARFSGSFSMFVAVFAGLGTIHIASVIDAADRPAIMGHTVSDNVGTKETKIVLPSRQRVWALLAIFLLVGGLSAMMTPAKISQISVPESKYEAAVAMDDYAERWDLEYPENDVLSQWDDVRKYNSIVNGQSKSYGYARATYPEFATATAPSNWADRLSQRPIGFIVVTELESPLEERTMHNRLFENLGSRQNGVSGLGHYRLIYVSEDSSVKSFAVVKGARISGTVEPNETIQVSASVTVDGESFTYERSVTADANGNFSVRVPYPTEYQVGAESVQVSEQAVKNGSTLTLSRA